MDDILELASNLGKRIAKDDRAKDMATARAAFESNLEARQLLDDYEKQQQKMATLEIEKKPIEPEDKRALADLHQRVVSNSVLKELLKAQTDFLDLMTQVSTRIEQEAMADRENG